MDRSGPRDVPPELHSVAERLQAEDIDPTGSELDRVWTTVQGRVARRTSRTKGIPMKLRLLAMSLLAVAALVGGTTAMTTVTGELAKSNQSAATKQYCPP